MVLELNQQEAIHKNSRIFDGQILIRSSFGYRRRNRDDEQEEREMRNMVNERRQERMERQPRQGRRMERQPRHERRMERQPRHERPRIDYTSFQPITTPMAGMPIMGMGNSIPRMPIGLPMGGMTRIPNGIPPPPNMLPFQQPAMVLPPPPFPMGVHLNPFPMGVVPQFPINMLPPPQFPIGLPQFRPRRLIQSADDLYSYFDRYIDPQFEIRLREERQAMLREQFMRRQQRLEGLERSQEMHVCECSLCLQHIEQLEEQIILEEEEEVEEVISSLRIKSNRGSKRQNGKKKRKHTNKFNRIRNRIKGNSENKLKKQNSLS